MSVNDLVPSVSIDALLLKREAMVERVREAHRLLKETDDIADVMLGEAWHGNRLNLHFGSTRHQFTAYDGIKEAISEIDSHVWAHLMERSGLRTFMDAESRAAWDKGIADRKVPELTRENIEATFLGLHSQRGELFERGVIQVFKHLSWVYKTNTPVMFGKRIVMRHICNHYGRGLLSSPSYQGCNQLDDLIRVMMILDGKPEPDHREGASAKLREAQWPGCGVAELQGMISLRGFKNGNAHITFLRPDLVEKLNKIIARHFPNALAPSREEGVSP